MGRVLVIRRLRAAFCYYTLIFWSIVCRQRSAIRWQLAGTAALVVCCMGTIYRANAANVGRSAPRRLLQQVLLHQTSHSMNMSVVEVAWQDSWRDLGFEVRLADDARCREDLLTLAAVTGIGAYLTTYDALETGVQRSDMWRYAVLYLHGGIYADIDVVAEPAIVELITSEAARPGIIFVESFPVPWPVSNLALALGLTDMVRLPQYRNCIMVAPEWHPALRATLDAIVMRANALSWHRSTEPARTLELTGPGVFTDAVSAWQANRNIDPEGHFNADNSFSAVREPMLFVSRRGGRRYFQHIGKGSWKTYRAPKDNPQESNRGKTGRTHGQLLDCGYHHHRRCLEEHEWRLLVFLCMVILVAVGGAFNVFLVMRRSRKGILPVDMTCGVSW